MADASLESLQPLPNTEENQIAFNTQPTPEMQNKTRLVGGTEFSWCKAVPIGTGITVLGLLFSKPPHISELKTALHDFQNSHPILRSKLHYDTTANTYCFVTPPTPHFQITQFDLQSTSNILEETDRDILPFHRILEHELNRNPWQPLPTGSPPVDNEVLFTSVYTISDKQWAVFLRLHTGACDRTAAVALLRGLLANVAHKQCSGGETETDTEKELGDDGEVSLGIEDLIPTGKANKPFWARGIDLLGYSLNSFRFANMDFKDPGSPRYSRVTRLQLGAIETQKLLTECEQRGVKLWGALAAAALLAVRLSKELPDHQTEKYAVATLIDCRPILDPPLCRNHLGFYHSAILNTHDVSRESLWDLAQRSYTALTNAKNSNKHFSDMSDLNFLMCKAIDNPGLTPSGSLRTACVSVFEDPVIDEPSKIHDVLGLDDYIGCASVHGVGPSMAIFDTIKDGKLDCAVVYPSPLHSREQMKDLIDNVKKMLVDGFNI